MEKSQTGFLYADDICLIASDEQGIHMIFESISCSISEYGMKVCIHGVKEERMWIFAKVELVR